MKANQLKWGSLLSYLQMALGVVISLLYTPVMIRLLGQSEYGLYQTAASTISMLGILNLGLGSGYVRYFAKYKTNNDTESIYKLNGLFLIIFSVLGIIALICGVFLSFNLDIIFSEGLTVAEYGIVKILMLLLTFNLALSFPMGIFVSIIYTNERYILLKLLGMIKTVLSPLVTLPLLLMGYRSVAMVTVTVVLSLITDILYFYYAIFVLKNRFIFHGFEKGIFKSLFAYTVFIAINMIVDQINWNIDKILLGRFKGTSAVAIYSVGYSLHSHYLSFSTAISSVFTPRVHKIVNQTANNIKLQRQQLTELFTKVGRIQFLILGLVASGVVFFGKQFIVGFWAGEGYEHSYYVALLLILPASIALIQNIGIEVQRAQNKHQFRSLAYALMAIANLGMSIVLCQKYGAVGSAIGTAISLILCNGLIMNIYYHKKCNIDILAFWKSLLRLSLGLILPIVFGIVLTHFFDINSVSTFILSVGIYTATYCLSMWLFGMNTYEKELVISPLKKILKKRSK